MKMFFKNTRRIPFLAIALMMGCKQSIIVETAANNHSLLWEVTGNGLSAPSYFLGTMHLMCAEDAVLSESAKRIIEQVDQIYLEVDLDNIGELLSGALSLKMANDTKLSDLLSNDEYEKVKDFFEEHQPGLPFTSLEQQQPLMLSSSLYELFLPCESKNGIDVRILEEAQKLNKETKGLETIAFQASIFDSIPYIEQANELVKAIDSIGKYQALLQEMVAIYQTQNIDKLHELTTKEEAGISSHTDLLLYNRNKSWAEKFDKIAAAQSTLFAVGAGHLGGEEGVINLLKQKGYKLRPLRN
jgi:hypothetical protein